MIHWPRRRHADVPVTDAAGIILHGGVGAGGQHVEPRGRAFLEPRLSHNLELADLMKRMGAGHGRTAGRDRDADGRVRLLAAGHVTAAWRHAPGGHQR